MPNTIHPNQNLVAFKSDKIVRQGLTQVKRREKADTLFTLNLFESIVPYSLTLTKIACYLGDSSTRMQEPRVLDPKSKSETNVNYYGKLKLKCKHYLNIWALAIHEQTDMNWCKPPFFACQTNEVILLCSYRMNVQISYHPAPNWNQTSIATCLSSNWYMSKSYLSRLNKQTIIALTCEQQISFHGNRKKKLWLFATLLLQTSKHPWLLNWGK